MPTTRLDSSLLLVLGMHRSGTSCLAGMLQSSGFSSRAIEGWKPDNQKGNREDIAFVELNDLVLEANDAAWNKLPSAGLSWTSDAHRQTRAEILSNVSGSGRPWIFKDPRMLLTLPFWQEALPDPGRIGIFRHPWLVAMSLYFRQFEQQSIKQGLALWIGYNKNLLAEHKRAGFPIVCFDLPPAAFVKCVADAVHQECGDLVQSGQIDLQRLADFYDDDLVHQLELPAEGNMELDSEEQGLLHDALAIYNQLCVLAGVKPTLPQTVPTEGPSVLATLKAADKSAKAGSIEHAMNLYRALLDSSKDPALIWRRMIKLKQDAGAIAEAAELIKEATQACPEDVGFKEEFAQTLDQKGQTEEALQVIDLGINERPDWWLLHERRGNYLRKLGRWGDTVSSMRRSRELNPDFSWSLVLLGVALLRTGHPEEGTETLQHALEKNGPLKQAAIHYQWAQALQAAGNDDLSFQHYERAVASENCEAYIVAGYAKELIRAKQSRQAESILRDALSKGKDATVIQPLLNRIAEHLH